MNRLFFLILVVFTGSLSGNDDPLRVMRSELAGAGLLPMTAKFCIPAPALCESADLSALFGTSGNLDPVVARGVVDWVVVQVVQAGAGNATATPGTCQTALLLENARIVDPRAYISLPADEKTLCLNGDDKACPPLYFSGADSDAALYFSVKHHNHLGVKRSVRAQEGFFDVDFTAPPSENTMQMQSTCGGVSCLRAGDLDGDGTVDGKDVQFFLNYRADLGKPFDYARADGQLDGAVNVEDVIRGVSPNLGHSGLAACPDG